MEDHNVLYTAYLNTPDGHRLYYECWGNDQGIPILFLHGGPGLGCNASDQRFFDPERHFVIFLDQRGAGKSRPQQNYFWDTPDSLVEDIYLLLQTLKLGRVFLFGGSWGSTLAILFAIKHPDFVAGMILRGFFPANQACIDFFTRGGAAAFFPEAWSNLISIVPEHDQHDPLSYYYKMLQSDDPDTRYKYALEWAIWGSTVNYINVDRQTLQDYMQENDPYRTAVQIVYYSMHRFFLPDNHIYDHLEKLKNIPIFMVQGRYDFLCPPRYAHQLARHLPLTELYIVEGSHSAAHPAIVSQLKAVLSKVEANFYL